MSLDLELVGAAARGEILVYFQPQILLDSSRIVGVECLSRWQHPTRGLLEPHDFISLAEENGSIREIDSYVFAGGLRCGAEWADRGTPVEVSVNVSANELVFPDFYSGVITALAASSFDSTQFTVEVTESQEISHFAEVMRGLQSLRELGVGISIDDYGTGFSSASQVRALPSTEIKIDRSIVQGGATSEWKMAEIVALAAQLGIRVVAEGIETEDQLERARRLGCQRGQGFLFGKAIPETEMGELLLVS